MPVGRLELHPEERALRMHIQRQTLEYAQTYITTDHIWYTETGVAEIFSTSLTEIPLFAPTEVSFPIDPLDKLLQTSNPEPYDEQFILSAEDRDGTRKVIAGHLAAFRSKGVGSKCMNVMKTEDPNVLETPRRPFSPILTARARQETPKILHRSRAQIIGMLPTEMNESVDRARIHSIRVEDVVDEHIPEESLLDIQYTMPKEEADEFRNLLMRVATNKTKQPPSGFIDFLRAESPPPPPFFPRPMSPRLFPRADTSKIGVDRARLDNLAETIGKIGVERVEVEEGFGLEEIAQENMRVLGGGFDILPPSSPPPLSHDHTQFTSSDAAQPSSPPRTPRIHPSERAFEVSSSPSVHDIKLAKLDEILFPSNQLRGRPLPKKDFPKFADMVADLHRPIPIHPETQTLPPVATILVPASPSISNDSIAGQPGEDEEIDELADDNSIIPSRRTSRAVSRRVSTKTVDSHVDELADDDTLVDIVVDRLTRGVGVDPFEYIIKEKLDEKEAMMLDVPELPPPNVSRTEAPQPTPTSLAGLVDLSKDGEGTTGAIGIRRIGGIKPLQIELGWRVTIPGEPLTLEQAVGVQNSTDLDVKSIVKAFRAGLNEVQRQERSFGVEQPGESVKGVGRGEAWARDGMILAREEREKVCGRRPSEQEQSLDPLNEETEAESRFDENEAPLPNIEPGTQASFVPLSFGTHGPQSQWDEPPYPEPEPRPYPSSIEEQPVEYRQSWVDDSGYYDQEMEVEVTEGEDDRYWFQILSQSSAGHAQQDDRVPATELEPAPGAGEQAYGAKEAFTVPMDIGPEVRAIEVLDSLEPGRRVGGEGVGTREYPHEVDSTVPTDVDSRAPAIREPEPPIPNPPFVQPEHSAPNKLAAFMYARAKAPALPMAPPVAPTRDLPLLEPAPARPAAEKPELYPIPPEIRSLITLSPDESPTPSHEPEAFRVLASMQLVQHRALVSALEHPSIGLHLVERSSASSLPDSITWPWQDTSTPLHGASLALDPNTALVFIPLADLASPDAVPALSRLLQSLLTRFEWIGLVLEAYPRPRPRSHALQPESTPTSGDREDFTLDPFTPPTLKALSALRRALVLLHNALGLVPIAGTGGVEVGIGRNVQETARVVRCAVDRAVESWRGREGRAGEVWSGREWVEDVDESMEEQELANVPGMNVFAAITVLAQTTVDDLLSMSAEERTRLFGPSITESKVAALNSVIAQGQARVEMIGQEQELGATEEGA